jgi:hypothetical protein
MTIKQQGGVFGRNPTFNDVTVEGNLTVAGSYVQGGDLTVGGNLTVNGATTTIESTTLQVEDPNILLGKDNTTDAQANGGGITLKGATNKTITWVDGTDMWTFNQGVDITGDLVVSGSISGGTF